MRVGAEVEDITSYIDYLKEALRVCQVDNCFKYHEKFIKQIEEKFVCKDPNSKSYVKDLCNIANELADTLKLSSQRATR